MWTLIALVITAAAAQSRWDRVTGGLANLNRELSGYRDTLGPFRKPLFNQRRDEVIQALEYAGCTSVLVPRQTDLFSNHRPTSRAVDPPDVAFLKGLLSVDGFERRRAYGRLVTQPPPPGVILEQTYYAVYALIEAELRPPFVRMFLRLQPRWPAFFVKRLLDLAANGGQGDRMYVVQLIRDCMKTKDPSVVRIFNLGPDVEADLDAIIASNGARLFGKGFAGAAPDQ